MTAEDVEKSNSMQTNNPNDGKEGIETEKHENNNTLESLAAAAELVIPPLEENTIEVVPTQEDVAKVIPPLEQNMIEVVPTQENVVALVNCGQRHRQALDNFDSTEFSAYFKEGEKFYGRKCSRCNIDLLEFMSKRPPRMITKEVFYCRKSKCPYMLCAPCNGLVLIHDP
jgi:hypothetical protein